MVNSFKKSSPIVKREKDRRWILALIILIILFLLLGTVVPLDKVPGVRSLLVSKGFDDIDNRGVTLLSILTGSSNLKINSLGGAGIGAAGRYGGAGGGYDASRSDLSYTMSAVSPFEQGPLGDTYLLDAQRLREAAIRSGSAVPQVYGVAKNNPDGYSESSDTQVDMSKFNAAQQGLFQGDVPLAREPSDGPPVESSLVRQTGASDIQTVNPQTNSGTLDYAARNMGKPARGQLQAMVNPKDRSKRGRAPLGNLNEFGAEPLNQAGTSWLFTRAGDRARVQESKKTLARAAFDGSVRPDEVVLKGSENAATVSDQASVDKDASQFQNDKLKTKVCQDAMNNNKQALQTLRDDMQTIGTSVIDKAPECCINFFNDCRSATQDYVNWNALVKQLSDKCVQYNTIQETINQKCGLCSTQGSNSNNSCQKVIDQDAAHNSNFDSRCSWVQSVNNYATASNMFNPGLRNPLRPPPADSPYTLEVLRVLNQEALANSEAVCP
ncbi:MAG: hypothetical protein FWF35_05380 [Elusimicrobia bacterium]|nr:hypothetical protein [Elusimicrobiota bacterium]